MDQDCYFQMKIICYFHTSMSVDMPQFPVACILSMNKREAHVVMKEHSCSKLKNK